MYQPYTLLDAIHLNAKVGISYSGSFNSIVGDFEVEQVKPGDMFESDKQLNMRGRNKVLGVTVNFGFGSDAAANQNEFFSFSMISVIYICSKATIY